MAFPQVDIEHDIYMSLPARIVPTKIFYFTFKKKFIWTKAS